MYQETQVSSTIGKYYYRKRVQCKPQGYSAFLSFVQKEERDDCLSADVLAVYQVFEASQSPGETERIISKTHLVDKAINKYKSAERKIIPLASLQGQMVAWADKIRRSCM